MKKVRSIYIIVSVASLALLFSSCKKNYLETSPTNQASQDDVFKTTTNAWTAINGIHRSLYVQYNGQQDQGGQSKNMIDMDFLGEDLVSPTTANGWFITTYRWQSHRNENSASTPFFNFQFYYQIIANANMIIANIGNAAGPDADKKAIRGQALAYRAWSYFQMIQLYAKRFDKTTPNDGLGLPLILEPTKDKLPRSTVAQVYTQIVADLAAAITNLSDAPARSNASHINLNVAKGMRARVAMAMQDWAAAAQFASEARQGFSLMSTAQYMTGFNNYTNPEWMWGSHQIQEQTTFFYSFFAFMSCDYNSTNIRTGPKCINSTLYNGISATDIRKQLWDPTGTNTAFPIPPGGARFQYMNRKFISMGGGSSIGDVPMMRTAEMYLIEAEAKARLGGQDAAAAQALFTLVKARDPNYVLSTNTGAALINEIMFHRRVELWGEGFRFYDLKRLNLPLDRNGANHVASVAVTLNVPAGDKQWEFLLPRTELNANPNCVQNPL